MTIRRSLMNPEQAKEQRLLEAALALGTEAERRAFLAAIADPAVRRRLEELVVASAEADSFFGTPPIQSAGAEVVEPAVASAPAVESPARMLGRYKLLERLGEGGFGEVWMAEQREPVKRRVALKIIKLGMDSRQVVARFEAERQALAMMDHPNIAKIFDAGAVDAEGADSQLSEGRPYFVMELVRGIKITEYCDQNQLPNRERLNLFIKVCQAIQHAHQKGIIHRDIKASNILVTLHDGVPVPKVIDFGIAKATQGELTDKTVFTQFQQFIGTPAYISPEQAEMSGLDIDTRSDIYSLGVLLYELMVGQTPFDPKEMIKGGLDALRKVIREKEPPRPSTKLNTLQGDARTTASKRRQTDVANLVRQLQGDLDWIIMKCLEKDRTRRYETANGLAMDIQRHLANEPVVARPPNMAYKTQKAWQRNKLAFTAAAAVALALAAGAIVGTWQAIRAAQAERTARLAQASEKEQRLAAQAQEQRARRVAYSSDLTLIPIELGRGNLGRARELLDRQRPRAGQEDLRGWEWRYLWNQCQSDPHEVLFRCSEPVNSLSVSREGRYVYANGTIWDRRLRKAVHTWPGGIGVFSPTDPLLVFWSQGTSDDPQGPTEGFHLWDFAVERMLRVLPSTGGFYRGLAFSKDGQVFVVNTTPFNTPSPQHLVSWKIPSGEPWQEPVPADFVSPGSGLPFALKEDASIAYQGTGATQKSTVRAIHLVTKETLWESQPMPKGEWVESLELSPEETVLAVAIGVVTPEIWLLDAQSGQLVRRLEGHLAYVRDLLFLPDGTLVSASADQSIRLWDLDNREVIPEPRVLRGHEDEVARLTVLPDGQTLISGGKDGTVIQWDTTVQGERKPPYFHFSARGHWAFTPDKTAIISVQDQGHVLRWTGPRYENSQELFELGAAYHASMVLDRGSTILAGYEDGEIKVWKVATHAVQRTFRTAPGPATPVDYASGPGWVVVQHGNWDGPHSICDLATGREIVKAASGRSLRLADDGRFFLWKESTNGLFRHDLVTDEDERLTWDCNGSLFAGVLSDDGRYLAITTHANHEIDESRVKVWNLEERGSVSIYGRFMKSAHSVAFSPDSQRIVAGGGGEEAIKIWDLESRQQVMTLSANGGPFQTIRFHDADTIVAATEAGVQHVWRAPSWDEIAAAEASDASHGSTEPSTAPASASH